MIFFTRCTFNTMCLVYVVSLLPIIQIHALSSTFHGSHIYNANPTYTTSTQYTPRRISNGNQLVMRKQKASNKRTARRQRGNIDEATTTFTPPSLSTSSSTTQILNSSPMTKSQWKHKKIEMRAAGNSAATTQSGGRGRARKRLRKSALVLFYHMISCVRYKDSAIWMLHLNLVCLYLIDFATHMY